MAGGSSEPPILYLLEFSFAKDKSASHYTLVSTNNTALFIGLLMISRLGTAIVP